MALLRDRDPRVGARIRLELYGEVDASNLALAAHLGLAASVENRGYVPHAAAVSALRRASLVFVPLHDIDPGERALVVPAKLYEALASGRPVLAALPDGDAADLVRATGRGVVAPPRDVHRVAAAILDLASRGSTTDCGADVLRGFERRVLARSLAATILAVLDRRRPAVEDPFEAARAGCRTNRSTRAPDSPA